MKWVAIGIVLALVVAVLSAIQVPVDNEAVLKSISDSCQREFGSRGEIAVNGCKIELLRRELEAREQRKMDRAASGVRH